VSCGEHTHQLRWGEGTLIALNHPDAEGERVLAALGGDRSECMDLVEFWGALGDDLEVLAIGPRSSDDELTLDPAEIAQLRDGGMWRPTVRGSALGYAQLRARATPGALLSRLMQRQAPPRVSAFFSGSHVV